MGHRDTGVVEGTVMVCQQDVLVDRILESRTQNTRILSYVFAAVESFAANCNAVHLQVARGSIRDYRDFSLVAEG
jgi:hypothetical protein